MLYYGDISSFFGNYCAAVTKKNRAFKKEEIVNLRLFVVLSFFVIT